MKWKVCALLMLILSLAGCKDGEEMESQSPVTDVTTEAASMENRAEAVNSANAVLQFPVFQVEDDMMTLRDSDVEPISGTRIYGTEQQNGLSERFLEAEEVNGVFPQWGAITLSFEDEVPLQITCYIDDGYGMREKRTVVTGTQGKATIYLGENQGQMLSSGAPNTQKRKLRIVCRYLNRNVEYLLSIGTDFQ